MKTGFCKQYALFFFYWSFYTLNDCLLPDIQHAMTRSRTSTIWDIDKIRARSFRGRKRSSLLPLFSLPIFAGGLKAAISGNATGLLLQFLLGLLFLFGIYQLREGLKAVHTYNQRSVATPPFPRKTISAVITAIVVVGLSVTGWQIGIIPALVYGVVSGALQYFAFGPDPKTVKGLHHLSTKNRDVVLLFVERAEKKLEQLTHMGHQIESRDIGRRLHHIIQQTWTLVQHLYDDPDDYRDVERFFTVYINSTQDALKKYTTLEKQNALTHEEKNRFSLLLNDLDNSIVHQRQKLLAHDKIAFDIEVDVLSERLQKYRL